MAKSKKNNNKAKLNLTVREEQRNKLEQIASLENRLLSAALVSVSFCRCQLLYETWLSDSISAARQPRRAKRNQAEKLSNRHREHSL
jgi:hypothetical protein